MRCSLAQGAWVHGMRWSRHAVSVVCVLLRCARWCRRDRGRTRWRGRAVLQVGVRRDERKARTGASRRWRRTSLEPAEDEQHRGKDAARTARDAPSSNACARTVPRANAATQKRPSASAASHPPTANPPANKRRTHNPPTHCGTHLGSLLHMPTRTPHPAQQRPNTRGTAATQYPRPTTRTHPHAARRTNKKEREEKKERT